MKPKGREQWRVVLNLLRMVRTFTATKRQALMEAGIAIERKEP
jgi:hypothetical protein